jgi:hypothetical protein
MFPKEKDPTGEPETWTAEELRRWLNNVNPSLPCFLVDTDKSTHH